MYSCWSGHQDVVKWLVEHTAADVNYNKDRLTPRTAAFYYDHLDIVKYILETSYADVNLPNKSGDTSLTWACR